VVVAPAPATGFGEPFPGLWPTPSVVPQYQDLRVLRGIAPREEHQQAPQPDHEQIEEAKEHECRA
jgi:hypothetical protein